ncbi:hypothetical protein PCL_09097 [Purpureocillium lilacinum]|uniref:Uncharacterized protein n=1 Tax=Purpureocillium lilacinum TaxID=33203 RepID=A0A2U3EH38_PURLI|nr:hypothetical protein PCL_09097 [Purpureocillium lilacinum]
MKASCLAPLGRSRARGRDIQQSSSARPNPLESVCPCVVVRVTTACLHSYFVCPKAAFFCALSRTATLHGDALLPKASLLHPGIQFLGAVYAQPRIESRHITSPSQGQGLLSPLTFLSRGPGCHLRGLAAGVSLTCLSSCPGPLQPPPPSFRGMQVVVTFFAATSWRMPLRLRRRLIVHSSVSSAHAVMRDAILDSRHHRRRRLRIRLRAPPQSTIPSVISPPASTATPTTDRVGPYPRTTVQYAAIIGRTKTRSPSPTSSPTSATRCQAHPCHADRNVTSAPCDFLPQSTTTCQVLRVDAAVAAWPSVPAPSAPSTTSCVPPPPSD